MEDGLTSLLLMYENFENIFQVQNSQSKCIIKKKRRGVQNKNKNKNKLK